MAEMIHAKRNARRAQQGEILLITLVALMLSLLGLVYVMRDTLINTQVVGNTLAKQKNAQVTDVGLRQLQSLILGTYNGQPLELSAASQPWYRDVAVGTAAPDATANYWSNCLGNGSSSLRCGAVTLSVNGNTLPYTALAVVQPTGRIDRNGCAVAQYTAVYYDLYVHVNETSGLTNATTETVYKLCTF